MLWGDGEGRGEGFQVPGWVYVQSPEAREEAWVQGSEVVGSGWVGLGPDGGAGGEAAEVGRDQIWENFKDLGRSPQLVLGVLKNFTQGVTRTELSGCGSGGLRWQGGRGEGHE